LNVETRQIEGLTKHMYNKIYYNVRHALCQTVIRTVGKLKGKVNLHFRNRNLMEPVIFLIYLQLALQTARQPHHLKLSAVWQHLLTAAHLSALARTILFLANRQQASPDTSQTTTCRQPSEL
jgi:hypothetical protein